MINVKVVCEGGYSWITDINCSIQEAKAYFIGNYWPVNHWDSEDCALCISCEVVA